MFKRKRNLLIGVLALILSISLFGSCKERDKVDATNTEESLPSFINLLPIPTEPDQTLFPLDTGLSVLANEKYALNDDTIGWLHVPDTSLNDEVLYYPDASNKFYYLRKDFYGNYSFAGSYFIDYRSQFEGGREGLSFNNVIYGHSFTDNPEDTLFSQLKKFKDQEFAESTPYIYFSTLEEDLAWEVFAVYVTGTEFLYNTPNPKPELLQKILTDSRAKSIYNYDVEVSAEDKILTLSTCLYNINGVNYSYPNNFRYVVMARLVPADEQLKQMASLKGNPSPQAP